MGMQISWGVRRRITLEKAAGGWFRSVEVKKKTNEEMDTLHLEVKQIRNKHSQVVSFPGSSCLSFSFKLWILHLGVIDVDGDAILVGLRPAAFMWRSTRSGKQATSNAKQSG